MRNGFLASFAGVLLSAGVVLGQEKPPTEKLPIPPEKIKELPAKTTEKPDKAAAKKETDFLAASMVQPGPGAGPDILRGSDAGFWTPHGQIWGSGEFLFVWTKEPRPAPPLVSGTVIVPPTSEEDPGGEQTLPLAGGIPDFKAIAGMRFSSGYWFEADRNLGVESSLLFLGKKSLGSTIPDSPRLQRPFINLQTREADSVLIASPGIAAGTISVTTSTRTWGLEANLLKNMYYEPIFKCVRMDLICGLRYLDLAEDIRVERATTFAPDLTATPRFLAFESNQLRERESIRTHNSFYGAQAGAGTKFFGECVVIDVRGKIAVGVNQERLIYQGEQLRIRPDGRRTTLPGALLALPSNIGKHRREQFTFVPEVSANIGIPLNNHIGIYGGYTFVYWNRVARPGDQVDRVADVSQIPNFPPPIPPATGIGRPGAPFVQSQWWMQGVTLGVEIHW